MSDNTRKALVEMIANFYHNATDPHDAAHEILSRFTVTEPKQNYWCMDEQCILRDQRTVSLPDHARNASCFSLPVPVEDNK